jgi:phytoene dehydrogenase-like protein
VTRTGYDAVIVGGGHNGLTAAAYLARAGRSVLVLERAAHLGGATGSLRVFRGVDANLSRYSYLVSLMPRAIRDELGLSLDLRRRRVASYTPLPGAPERGLLVDTGNDDATLRSFAAIGAEADHRSWLSFGARTHALAQAVFPSVTGPLPTSARARAAIGEQWWADLHAPLGELVERTFGSDLVRGVVLTDALIGTFADAHDATLIQNRCFLYHVIGGGTGDWDVPVGGMGAVVEALTDAARAGGAELVTRATVRAVLPGPKGAEVVWTDDEGVEHSVTGGHVLVNAAPRVLATLLGDQPPAEGPEGSQLKVNMVLSRLPRLRDGGLDPKVAFAGTFHINESYEQLATAHAQAAAGLLPKLPPAETYCHTLTDPSILGAGLRASGHHTLTLFGLHMPARLFREDPEGAREAALAATIRSLDSVLAEPIEDCLALDADGLPCLEARSPVDLEDDIALPGGHIFHRDLQWPWLEDDAHTPAERWGVATANDRVLLCGAGARRGGGVSGIPGRSAAMALLEGSSRS